MPERDSGCYFQLPLAQKMFSKPVQAKKNGEDGACFLPIGEKHAGNIGCQAAGPGLEWTV